MDDRIVLRQLTRDLPDPTLLFCLQPALSPTLT